MNKGIQFNSWALFFMSLSLLILSLQVQAESEEQYYITPELQLGLHTKASMESPVKLLISSGMAVKVIKVEKEFSLIKTETGSEGWVKNQFLTNETPAVLQVVEMKEALQRAQDLMKARLKNDTEKASVEDATQNSQLSNDEKAAYEETIAELKDEIKAWEQLDHQDKVAQQAQAEKANQILKEKLAMIASVAIGQDVDASQFDLATEGELPQLRTKPPETFLKIIKKNYILMLMIMGLSFLLGIFLMDLVNRRRHGGYRI